MKKILCFGDSNTFGFNPENAQRYPENVRWSSILKNLLKNDFEVVEAGCNNRTAFSNNPSSVELTGYRAIGKYKNDKFDIVIISLGINDLQKSYNVSLADFEKGFNDFINIVKENQKQAKIIILIPSKLKRNILNSFFSTLFDESSIEKSYKLPLIYKKIIEKQNCLSLDLNDFIETSDIDGLHYSKESHKLIAHKLYEIIKVMVI